MKKWVAWVTLVAFLVSIPVLGGAQSTEQEQQAAPAPQEEVGVGEEIAIPEQPEAAMEKPAATERERTLPPLAAQRVREPRAALPARAIPGCPARAVAGCPSRPSAESCQQITPKKQVAKRPKTKRVAKRRAVSGKICLSRAEYQRLLAAAKGTKRVVMKRISKRVVMKSRPKRVAKAQPASPPAGS